MTQEFSYIFFLNETFDPTRAYSHFDGYQPGAKMDKAYEGEVTAADHIKACDKLFEIFNINHPADYRNRSMSVGDVIMLTNGVTVRYFSVESFGFNEIGDPALQAENPNFLHMNDYFQHQNVYERFRRERTPELFLTYIQEVKRQKVS